MRIPSRIVLLACLLVAPHCAGAADGRGLALCVGVNGYYSMGKLKYSTNDAIAIRDALEASGDYANIFLLADRMEDGESPDPRFWPLQNNIMQALRQIANSAGPDDRLLFFFSGHGVQRDGKHYLVPLDGREDNAIAMDEIKAIMADSKAGAKLLLVDACRSGGGMKGVPGVRGSVENVGIGMIVSCAEDQFSYEDDEYKRSVFSLMLEEALTGRGDSDGDMRLTGDEVHRYLTRRMNDYCLEKGIFTSQTPQINADGRTAEVLRLSPVMVENSQSPRWRVKDMIADGHKLMQSDDPELDGPEAMALFEEVIAIDKVPDEDRAKALYFLGRCHADGIGSVPDHLFAIDYWEEAAELGNVDAQYALAHTYYEGIDVYPDYDEALRWAELAAEKNHVDAQVMMGRILYEGKHDEPDYREAAKWFRKASSGSDNPSAQYWLGVMYRDGNGFRQNHRGALKWFQQAAEAGHADAQIALGEMLIAGQGGKKDAKEGMKWLARAAESGDGAGLYNMGMLYYDGTTVTRDIPEAISWFERAAGSGEAKAVRKLAAMYEEGDGVSVDAAKAARYLEQAANMGDGDAQLRLGVMYYEGNGVKKDVPRAVGFLRSAAEGSAEARVLLGRLHYEGKDVPQNYAEAAKWLRRAAADGDAGSKAMLGTMYAEGLGVKQDPAEALKWLDADASDPEMCYVVGRLYLGEIGGAHDKVDRAEAKRVLRRAAEKGHAPAQCKLASLLYDDAEKRSPETIEPAVAWWTKAAEQGSVEAQVRLGDLYGAADDAAGVATDYEESAKWYRLAAQQGDVDALNRLGDLHLAHGNDTDDNKAQARKLLGLAAAKGDGKAKRAFEQAFPGESWDSAAAGAAGVFDVALDTFFARGNPALESALALYEKNEYAAAREIYKPLAAKGDIAAQYNLAAMYYTGNGLDRNPAEAHALWRKAAEQGSADAQCKVGLCYMEGIGVQMDYAAAASWFKKAAEQGHADACHRLGHLYYDGRGVSHDSKESTRLFKLAKAKGVECENMEAALNMARWMEQSGTQTAAEPKEEPDGEPPAYVAYLIKDVPIASHQASAQTTVQVQPVYQQQPYQQQYHQQPSYAQPRQSAGGNMVEAARVVGGLIRAFR